MGGERAEEADRLLLALGREVAADAPAGVDHAGAERLRQGGELVQRPPGDGRVPGGVVEVELVRRNRLVDGAELRLGAERGARASYCSPRAAQRAARDGADLVVEQHRRAGQVVEDRLQPLVEERQPVLEALHLAAGADRLVERVVVAGGAEVRAVAGAEALDRGVVEDHLGDRRQLDALHRLGGALRRRVEAPGTVEHVAEQVEPHRRRARRAGRCR